MRAEQWWNDTDRENLVVGVTAVCDTTNMWIVRGSNLDVCNERLMTNSLIHGMDRTVTTLLSAVSRILYRK
jgi:hypothetical protein